MRYLILTLILMTSNVVLAKSYTQSFDGSVSKVYDCTAKTMDTCKAKAVKATPCHIEVTTKIRNGIANKPLRGKVSIPAILLNTKGQPLTIQLSKGAKPYLYNKGHFWAIIKQFNVSNRRVGYSVDIKYDYDISSRSADVVELSLNRSENGKRKIYVCSDLKMIETH